MAAALDVFVFDLAEEAVEGDFGLLGPDERDRALRFASAKLTGRYVAGRAGLRHVLGERLGCPPQAIVFGTDPCPRCGDVEHGRPVVRHPSDLSVAFSTSRSHGAAAVAVADCVVGVDIEQIEEHDLALMADTCLCPRERAELAALSNVVGRSEAFCRAWVRKEAVLKGVGVGIVAHLDRIDALPVDRGEVTLDISSLGIVGGPLRWSVREVEAQDGFCCAVATPVGAAADLVVHRGVPGRSG